MSATETRKKSWKKPEPILAECSPNHFEFDDYTIGPVLYSWIKALIPFGSVILELGSGRGSGLLSRDYTVYSVEDNPDFVGLYETNYICAPGAGWYDPEVLRRELPASYDCLLIDGPRGSESRLTLLDNLQLFDLVEPIIFCDDVHRRSERTVFDRLVEITQRASIVIEESFLEFRKQFGILGARQDEC
jgi:hypothetical protein